MLDLRGLKSTNAAEGPHQASFANKVHMPHVLSYPCNFSLPELQGVRKGSQLLDAEKSFIYL